LYTPQNHGERILILFDPDILSLLSNEELIEKVKKIFQQKKVSLDSCNQHSIDEIMNRICDYYFNSANPNGEIKARLGLLELLLNVLELPQNNNAEIQTPEVSPKEKRVMEVVTYINSHYHSDINLGILCKELFINKYYLCHIFKEVTGLSVIDFINTKRLAEAERLLRYSRLNITDVCEAVGFNSISHFIDLFKKSYNNTPRGFRNSLEKR
jgi:AraC-like DNA-binding protein